MRKLALGVGTAALLTAAAAAPAMAQVGFYAGPFGVGVGVGAPAYYDCGYNGYPTITAALTSWSGAGGAVGTAAGTMVGMAATSTSTTANDDQ
jgi:hypothetical protein